MTLEMTIFLVACLCMCVLNQVFLELCVKYSSVTGDIAENKTVLALEESVSLSRY